MRLPYTPYTLWAVAAVSLALMGCMVPATLFQSLPQGWQSSLLIWMVSASPRVLDSIEQVLRVAWIPAAAFLLLYGWRYRRSGVVIPALLVGGLGGALATAVLLESSRNVVVATLAGMAGASLLLAGVARRWPSLTAFVCGGLSGAVLLEIVTVARTYRPSYELRTLMGIG